MSSMMVTWYISTSTSSWARREQHGTTRQEAQRAAERIDETQVFPDYPDGPSAPVVPATTAVRS